MIDSWSDQESMPVTGGGAHVLSECQTSGAGGGAWETLIYEDRTGLSALRKLSAASLRRHGAHRLLSNRGADPAWTRGDPVCERGFADLGFARSALRTGLTTQRDLQGPAHLPHDDAAPGAPPRRRVRLYALSCRLSALPAVRGMLGQDVDDAARPARSARPSSHHARIRDDAAGLNLGRATGAASVGQLVRDGAARSAARPASSRQRRQRLSRFSRA